MAVNVISKVEVAIKSFLQVLDAGFSWNQRLKKRMFSYTYTLTKIDNGLFLQVLDAGYTWNQKLKIIKLNLYKCMSA